MKRKLLLIILVLAMLLNVVSMTACHSVGDANTDSGNQGDNNDDDTNHDGDNELGGEGDNQDGDNDINDDGDNQDGDNELDGDNSDQNGDGTNKDDNTDEDDNTDTVPDEIILLIDASYSLDGAQEEINLFVKSVIDTNNSAKLGIVTFGHDQVYAVELSGDSANAYEKYLASEAPDNTATNIADAVAYTSTLFTPDARAKIVLISDGAQTDGDAAIAVKDAASKGITVDTICFNEKEAENEVQIISVNLPDEAIEVGKAFTVQATVQSSCDTAATLRIYDNGISGGDVTVQLTEGVQTISVPYEFVVPGLHGLSVEIICDNDGSIFNNVYTSCVYIDVWSEILIIENIPDESYALCQMLTPEMNVNVVNVNDPEMLPTSVDELRLYDQVILVNIANKDMPEGFDAMLYSYVYDFGGGLLTVCGNDPDSDDGTTKANAYTKEDMFGSLYQAMLPVNVIEYTPPAAVVFIIDNSGSMESSGNDIKQSTIAALDALTERDYVGIIALDAYYNGELPELISLTQRDRIISEINKIEFGGGISMLTDALGYAGKALINKDVAKRHVILITDGYLQDITSNECRNLARENAVNGITMSIVEINSSSYQHDIVNFLMYHAGMSEDNYHRAPDNTHIALILRDDLSTPAIKDVNIETFTPTILNTDSPVADGITQNDMFTLDGFFGVVAKDGAEIILMGKYTPIYTRWKFGLGAVGTFACDLNGTWSWDMINSYVGALLVNNIVRDLLPTEDISPIEIDLKITEDNYIKTATVITDLEEGEYIKLTVTNSDGDEVFQGYATNAIDGHVSLTFDITTTGIYIIQIQKMIESDIITAEAIFFEAFSYSKEFDAFYDRETAREYLEDLAEHGNGTALKNPEDVFVFHAKSALI